MPRFLKLIGNGESEARHINGHVALEALTVPGREKTFLNGLYGLSVSAG
jgi:hypothetical protein